MITAKPSRKVGRVAAPDVVSRGVLVPNAPWPIVAFGSVLVAIGTGKSFKCEERPPHEGETGVAKVSAVTWGTYDESESKTCHELSRIKDGFLIRPGDFLFTRANTIELIGACVIVGAVTRRVMLSDKILRFIISSQVLPKWVLYWLRSLRGREEIERLSTGNQASMRNIGQDRIRQIKIPLPPLPDQRRIVAEIEKQFTRLDAGVAALRRTQANLKRYRAAVLKVACEGRLVPTEAELARKEALFGGSIPKQDFGALSHGSNPAINRGSIPRGKVHHSTPVRSTNFETGEQLLARILTEHRKNWQGRGQYKEPAAPATQTLPAPPNGWIWASVDQLITDATIGLDRGRARQSEDATTGLPYIKMNNVTMDGRVLFDDMMFVPASKEEAANFLVCEGDILFNTRNSKELVGKVGLVRTPPVGAIYNNNLMRIRVSNGVSPSFFNLQLCSRGFRQRMELVKKATTNIAAVYGKDLWPLPFSLPPLAEQTRIVAEVERRLSVVDQLDTVVTANLQHATRLRQSILQKAFAGELPS